MNGRYVLYTVALGALACVASSAAEPRDPNFVLNHSKLGDYVARFNAEDEELYGKGSGLRILADGREIGATEALGRLTVALPKN